jgi:hypothetical protein
MRRRAGGTLPFQSLLMGGAAAADKSNMGSFVTVLFGAGVGVGVVLGLWLLADLVSDLQRHVHGPHGR